MLKAHDDEAEAVKAFSDRVNTVIGGRWLGVVANVDDEGHVHLFRTTWQFPREKYIEVLGLLATELSKDSPVQPSVQQITMEDFLSLQRKLQEHAVESKEVQVDEQGNYVSVKADMEKAVGASCSVTAHLLRDDDPIHISPEDLADKVVSDINKILDEEGPV